MSEVIRVNTNAMPSNQTRAERQKIPLTTGSVKHGFCVDTHFIKNIFNNKNSEEIKNNVSKLPSNIQELLIENIIIATKKEPYIEKNKYAREILFDYYKNFYKKLKTNEGEIYISSYLYDYENILKCMPFFITLFLIITSIINTIFFIVFIFLPLFLFLITKIIKYYTKYFWHFYSSISGNSKNDYCYKRYGC